MSPFVFATLVAVFISVALVSGSVTAALLSLSSTERKRLQAITREPRVDMTSFKQVLPLSNAPRAGVWHTVSAKLGRSPKELAGLRLRLTRAGFDHPAAPVVYTFLEFGVPIILAGAALYLLEGPAAWLWAGGLGVGAYFAPGFFVDYRLSVRRREIQNGLPDALDLLVVCIEAGCGIDQAIVKTSDELALTYPVLANELRILTAEVRAGKPRIEAFKSLAQRTRVDDIRALVAMLIQTDRFGTSIGQALRTHSDTSRTKRRQRAEEQAQKIAVKLVFPLVLCFFPAFYVVVLGPAVIQFVRTFMK